MCDSSKAKLRTHRSGSAKLTHCLMCNTLAFQVGTAYFVVKPDEIGGLVQWFSKIRDSESDRLEGETFFLQIERSRIMLALTTRDFEDLMDVLHMGCLWTNVPIPPPPVPELARWVN